MAKTKAVLIRADDGFDLPKLGLEDGTAFGYFDRWNMSMTRDDKYVTDLSDWEARDMHEMLTKDYKSKQIENVLTLPVTSAEYTIQPADGDKGEAAWLKSYWDTDKFSGGCRTSLDQIIGLMTSAFYFKRAYFEKVWRKGLGKFVGKLVYDDVAWRPQTTCRLMRDPHNGRFHGFEQQAYFLGPNIQSANKWPIQIPPARAFVYTHGTRRDPLNGTSDMEVAYWAWKTKQKILMLWFQFLQSVSLPRIVVKGTTVEEARSVASEIARMKSSGVLPVGTAGGPQSVDISAMDVSGKGADQFLAAIAWLDNAATQSVLAGFLNLTNRGTPMDGVGSFALSKDASDFFLQSLEAKAREMEDQIRTELFAPLIYHNFGPGSAVPKLQFEPLNDIDKDASLELLKMAMAAPPGGPVPTQFIAALAGQVATYLGIDGESTRDQFKASFDAAAAQAQAKMLAEQPGAAASPTGTAVAGMAGAVQAAHTAIAAGTNPSAAHAQAKRAVGADAKAASSVQKAQAAKTALLTKHAKNAVAAKTGGDVSLSNVDSEARARNGRWVKTGEGHFASEDGKFTAELRPSGMYAIRAKGSDTVLSGTRNLNISKGSGASGVTEADKDRYTMEHCGDLALALHKATGYPLAVITDGSEPQPGGLPGWVHAGVLTPGGKFLDVNGAHDPGDALEEYADYGDDPENAGVVKVSAAKFGKQDGVAADAQAESVAQRVLKVPGLSLSREDTDLAGFNPAEPRAGGKWAAGGKAGTAKLVAERAQLRAEAAHLRAEIAKIGTHKGQAGVHRGQAGAHAGPKNAGPTKAAPGSAKGSKGSSAGGGAGGGDLAAQVAHLKKVVAHLTTELAGLQERAARRSK